ncbi:hypothetical protein I5P86_01365 [Pseudomonas glycinae]|uniref:hypothetical protein n=1 Tax=Pseudomonas glycinae TaxID=1785145 RepID=UPI0018D74E55|nr:hypothetical protein [Pseudomonas glycinae]MBH3403692.1 hypothetical protein [Pseudomonas glycinae]
MAKYVVLPEATLFYNDSKNHPLKSPFGVNMKDPNNAAYQTHGLPYGPYQRLSGISIKVPANTPDEGVLSLYIDNAILLSPQKTYSLTLTTVNANSPVYYVNTADMLKVDVGVWNVYGNMYVKSTDTYYIFTTKNVTMQLP